MKLDKQSLGKFGEQLAVNFLKKKGYRILSRNFKTSRFGEIDIVAQDYSRSQIKANQSADSGGFKKWNDIFNFIRNRFVICRWGEAPIVFIEVKTKSGDEFGGPEDEFTIFKKQKMHRAIQDWFWRKKIETNNWRIDLIAVDFSKDEKNPEIRHYPGLS